MSSAEVSPRHVRPDMVASAVSFLRDAKVQQSSVSQRVSFLESKGLSPDEIDEALRQTGSSGAITAGVASQAGPSHAVYQPQQQQPYYQPYGAPAHMMPPQQQQRDRDWRDWFIMAVVTGTVGYGVISLARKYLVPHLQPPNQTILEEDRDALTAKYDEVAAQLATLDAETKAVKAGVEEQRAAIEKSLADVEDAVKTMREADKRRAGDMDTVKSDVDAMKESLARMFEKTKEAQTTSLAELQNELKSLKSLLVSRNASSAATSGAMTNGIGGAGQSPRPYSPFGQQQDAPSSSISSPSLGNNTSTAAAARPSIPAWQLADSSSASSTSKAAAASSDAAPATSAADEPSGTTAAEAGSENAAKAAEQTSS